MDDIWLALLTTFLTVISGVLVYIFSEIMKEKVLIPLHDYKKLRGKIYFSLILYAREISSPLDEKNHTQEAKESYQKAADEFRTFAAELAQINRELFWGSKRKKDKRERAWHSLIGLSNSFFGTGDFNHATIFQDEVRSYLDLR